MHYLLIALFLLTGCGYFKKEVDKDNLEGEYITNNEEARLFTPPPPLSRSPRKYPWSRKEAGGFPRITKDYFRCRGSNTHPTATDVKEGDKKFYYKDCVGGDKHGLPLREGKEHIYPCLIDLLNYVQEKTKKRVVITTGHRCPQHNTYVDRAPNNRASKHMLGAEVDFYVDGMERDPEKVISLIQAFYKEKLEYKDEPAFITFERAEAAKYNLTVAPWQNKEIFIKLHLEHEGRDFDNSHPYPYITVQVRYDKDTRSKVMFDEKLIQNYMRK